MEKGRIKGGAVFRKSGLAGLAATTISERKGQAFVQSIEWGFDRALMMKELVGKIRNHYGILGRKEGG